MLKFSESYDLVAFLDWQKCIIHYQSDHISCFIVYVQYRLAFVIALHMEYLTNLVVALSYQKPQVVVFLPCRIPTD